MSSWWPNRRLQKIEHKPVYGVNWIQVINHA